MLLATDVVKSKPTKSGVNAAGKPVETLLDRYARLRDLSAEVVHHASVADLVVIEGLIASPARNRGVHDRPALWWIIVGALCRRNIPVAEASPSAMKRVIVGPR